MLAAHRGDIFLQDEAMVLYAIKNIRKINGRAADDYDHIIAIDAPVSAVNFHLLVHKDSPLVHILPRFDAAVRAMHQDGDFAEITDKWLH